MLGRLALRLSVTDAGRPSPTAEPARGDPFGVPGFAGGNLDRAE